MYLFRPMRAVNALPFHSLNTSMKKLLISYTSKGYRCVFRISNEIKSACAFEYADVHRLDWRVASIECCFVLYSVQYGFQMGLACLYVGLRFVYFSLSLSLSLRIYYLKLLLLMVRMK